MSKPEITIDDYMDSIPAHTFASHTIFELENSAEYLVRIYYEEKLLPSDKFCFLDAIVTMLMNYHDFLSKDTDITPDELMHVVQTRFTLLKAISDSQRIVHQ